MKRFFMISILVVGICLFMGGMMRVQADPTQAVGEKAIITESVIIGRQTGTGPWDEDNNPGNDMDADNNIIRSFDQVSWTIENTMALKESAAGESYKGGILEVKAELPTTVLNPNGTLHYMDWDLSAMTWAEDGAVSDDGRVFTGTYHLNDNEDVGGAKQSLNFVLKVFGAPNGMEISPVFTIGLLGNTEEEKYIVRTDNNDLDALDSYVVTSAAPRLNIQVLRNRYMNYKNYFDFETGNSSETATANTVFGRMQGYGITLQLYNPDSNKKMKGIELPSGDITFDLVLEESVSTGGSTQVVTEQDGFTPVMWDYKENELDGDSGKENRNMHWHNNRQTRYACWSAPYNTGNGRLSCYQGGTWNITQDATTPYLYHVTVSGYEFNNDYNVTTNDAGDGESTASKYGEEFGKVCFSSGYVQVIMEVPEDYEETQSIYIKAEANNIDYVTLSNQERTTEDLESDNRSRIAIDIHPAGSYTKRTWYGNSNATSTYITGDNNVFIGHTGGYFDAYISVGNENDVVDWGYGIDFLLKIDDRALEPALTSTEKEFSTSYTDMTFNVIYAGKSDKSGWESDQEMIDASMDDLVYFETLEELYDAGYTCVGFMIESTSGVIDNGTQVNILIPYVVKETAEIGEIYQLVGDIRFYDQNNVPDRTTQTHTLTTDPADFPTVRYAKEHDPYVKTAYDEMGQVAEGTHFGGTYYGDSLLIKGATQTISIRTIDDNDDVKVNYNIGKGETDVTIELSPSITTPSAASISGITLKVEATLPEGLTYTLGTANLDEAEVIESGDGTTTVVWYIENCSVNEAITPITFVAKLDEELGNGNQLDIETVVSESVLEGEETKIGNTARNMRVASTSIQIINLASYNLFKTTETPVIEAGGSGEYIITAINKTDDDVVDVFQVLDILPYVGDDRGTSYSGSYTVSKISLAQYDSSDNEIENNSIHLYITDDTDVREDVSANNIVLGAGSMFSEATFGAELNQALTGFVIKGTLKARTKVEVKIEISTTGNKPLDKYVNSATAQTNPETEVMVSPVVMIEVVKRTLSGYAWLDTNENGLINTGEPYLAGIVVTLVNEDGTPAKRYNGTEVPSTTTNASGYYVFNNLAKGNYKVQVELDHAHMTLKGVGTNTKINSKFNSTKETDVITKLNAVDTLKMTATYINAGFVYDDAEVIVHHYKIDDEGNKTEDRLSGDEQINKKYNDEYETNPINTEDLDYELAETPDNATGIVEEAQIIVNYYYAKKEHPYTVKYVDKITGESIHEDKIVEENRTGDVIASADEVIAIQFYRYDSADKESLTISANHEENVITLFYTKRASTSISSAAGKVVIKYIDKNTGRELVKDITKRDAVGKDYTSEEKQIDGYVFVESTDNTEGKFTIEDIEVIYYYEPTYSLKEDDDGHHEWYLRGYEDYTFRMSGNVTREEVATIFYRLTVTTDNDMRQDLVVSKDPYSDVDKDRWSARPIAYMKQLGIMLGYEDGTFKPANPITRAEFAQVIMKYAKEKTKNVTMFQDISEDYWAKEAIEVALSQGWIEGYQDGTFKPTQKITRVETVTIINRMLKRKLADEEVSKIVVPVVDLDATHWGYGNVLEAITSHDYILNEDGEEIWTSYRYPFHEDMSEDAYNDV